MTHQVYVIQIPFGKQCIPLSESVEVRVLRKDEGISKWTAGRGPWELIWTSELIYLM